MGENWKSRRLFWPIGAGQPPGWRRVRGRKVFPPCWCVAILSLIHRRQHQCSSGLWTRICFNERSRNCPDGRGRRGQADRKSVVWGKSVSVRVDLGGRRIIKKKINKVEQKAYTLNTS